MLKEGGTSVVGAKFSGMISDISTNLYANICSMSLAGTGGRPGPQDKVLIEGFGVTVGPLALLNCAIALDCVNVDPEIPTKEGAVNIPSPGVCIPDTLTITVGQTSSNCSNATTCVSVDACAPIIFVMASATAD